MAENGYAHPEVLVETQWVADHLHDPGMRLVEVDVDTTAYDSGHIPGAVGWNWQRDTQDTLRRNVPGPEALQALLRRSGIGPETTVVLYGDNNNWFAAYAFWLLRYYGHERACLVDGGRVKWIAEGRPLTTEVPRYPPTEYTVRAAHTALRARRDDVLGHIGRAAQRS